MRRATPFYSIRSGRSGFAFRMTRATIRKGATTTPGHHQDSPIGRAGLLQEDPRSAAAERTDDTDIIFGITLDTDNKSQRRSRTDLVRAITYFEVSLYGGSTSSFDVEKLGFPFAAVAASYIYIQIGLLNEVGQFQIEYVAHIGHTYESVLRLDDECTIPNE